MQIKAAEEVFDSIVGKRFANRQEIERWIRGFTKCNLPELNVGEEGVNEPVSNADDFMDCTFGSNMCGKEFADFTLFFIKTNAGMYYITEACWSY